MASFNLRNPTFFVTSDRQLIPIQFISAKLPRYYFKKTIRFDVKASFARRPALGLIKPGDITKEF